MVTEFGSPLSPSQTAGTSRLRGLKNTSATPLVLQFGEHVQPVLRGLPADPGAWPDPEHVAVSVQVDPDRGVERLVADLPVTDLDIDGVDEDRPVHAVQGRADQACMAPASGRHPHSITLSVIRETVSLDTDAP